MLSVGHAPMSYSTGSQIRLNLTLQGIGPNFKVNLQVQNIGKIKLMDLPILFSYNEQIYKINVKNAYIPLLIPGLNYKIDIDVLSIDATGAADIIKVMICEKNSTIPLITANINMPISDQNIDI